MSEEYLVDTIGQQLHEWRKLRIELLAKVAKRPNAQNVTELLTCVTRIEAQEQAIVVLRPNAHMLYLIGMTDEETLGRDKHWFSETSWLDKKEEA